MSFMQRTSLTVLKPTTSTVPKCGRCGLFKTCESPKMKTGGEGKKGILVVGEAPGEDEDEQGLQFVGKTGTHLQRVLRSLGIELHEDCWTDNALICRPPRNEIDDKKKIGYCRPNLLNTIRRLNPRVIILLGAVPVDSLIGHLWKENVGGIKRWAGWRIPHQKLNAWVCPTFHPSYVVRMDDKVVDRQFREHLQAAINLKGRPYKERPDYKQEVNIVLDDLQAASMLMNIRDGDTIAFDFENDRLKPDHKDALIVSCSVCCNGEWTIAFPWYGKVIPAMEKLLRNPRIKKVGSNIKHEQRWCKRVLGYRVKGWYWDTMTSAHCLDPRGKISSVKFQAFVRLGSDDYDSHIKPFLTTKGGNEKNRIKDIDLRALLLYNGLDSLLEYKVMEDQRREFNGGDS